MEKFKAIWNIVQTFLLLLAGFGVVAVVVIYDQATEYKLVALTLAGLCVMSALIPMAIAYVQTSFPKLKKK